MQSDDPALRYTIYDPFWECLYCRKTFNDAAEIADRIGCGLILAVPAEHILDAPVCRYRKTGGEWRAEAVNRPA